MSYANTGRTEDMTPEEHAYYEGRAESAEELHRLRDRVEELERALRPFATPSYVNTGGDEELGWSSTLIYREPGERMVQRAKETLLEARHG